jgi:hypothetical protein
MWSLGAWGGGVRRIPARPAAGLAREEVRWGLGALGSPMVAGAGVGRRRREVRGGAREMWPRRMLFRRKEDRNQPTSDSASFSLCLGAGLRELSGGVEGREVEHRVGVNGVGSGSAVARARGGDSAFIGNRRLQG